MYGDFSPHEVLPTTYEEAVRYARRNMEDSLKYDNVIGVIVESNDIHYVFRFYKQLPDMTGSRADNYTGSAPLLVKITPLKMLCEVI